MNNSWKTSLLGIAAAGLNLFANGTNWKQVLLSVGVAALGVVAKDGDKSNAPNPLSTSQSTSQQ